MPDHSSEDLVEEEGNFVVSAMYAVEEENTKDCVECDLFNPKGSI